MGVRVLHTGGPRSIKRATIGEDDHYGYALALRCCLGKRTNHRLSESSSSVMALFGSRESAFLQLGTPHPIRNEFTRSM